MVAIVLLALLAAGVWTASRPVLYTSTATGTVSETAEAEQSFLGANLAHSRLPSYVELGQLRSVAEYAQEQSGLDASPSALAGAVQVASLEETFFIEVTAWGESPDEARLLAEAWLEGMSREVDRLESGSYEQSGQVQLVQYGQASTPRLPSSPDIPLIMMMALAGGIMLAVTYAVLRHYFARTVRSAEQLELRSGQPVLASFRQGMSDQDEWDRLRVNIQFKDVDNPPRVVEVTSVLPEDQRQRLAIGLAEAFSGSGAPTYVIDADLRRPGVHQALGIEQGPGLTEILTGEMQLDEVIQQPDSSPQLRVVSAGALPPNPSELLGSQAMSRLIRELRGQGAQVLVCVPPATVLTDAAVVAQCVDGVLLMVTAGGTSLHDLDIGLKRLKRTNAPLLGLAAEFGGAGQGKRHRDVTSLAG